MLKAEGVLTVDIDYEIEDVVISWSAGELTTSRRCRVLYGWLLLYLLDPEPFDEIGKTFCEESMATNPPVGITKTGAFAQLRLSDGFLSIPVGRLTELKDALAAKLTGFAGSLGPLF